uniref:PiggyBac transposable element-derived protein domain-containing protein n=1 Tax=Odontella aurita TaxID=265563 RepID=A0A7S4J1G4_9STRA|mmetsp:Transcript_35505/g.106014  ORF Transcript_35505/g.106014 Transcript_35505/m.106014 type:complete len:145 (+) Transcript_35505:223-657(+)
MMVRFMGRSSKTHRIPNKPVSEGYKLFVLANSRSGCVLDITPDGRLSAKRKSGRARNEYNISDTNKTISMIKHLTRPLVKDMERHKTEYKLALDNYFKYPRVMSKMRAAGIGVVGTARKKKGWPPKELQVMGQLFNNLYWCVDD